MRSLRAAAKCTARSCVHNCCVEAGQSPSVIRAKIASTRKIKSVITNKPKSENPMSQIYRIIGKGLFRES
jgi:hypothetical protein